MQKIIIDTNVFVSALIQRGYSYLIINELFVEQRIQLCVSDDILAEYFEVLSRPKFSKFQEFFVNAEILISQINLKAIKYVPTIKLELINDLDDNKFLELADECSADFLITGNTNDFTFPFYKQTKILTPREYWENFQPHK